MIILIIGPAGAGKSTVSRMLSEHFERCALIEADVVRHMVKTGMASPFEETVESEKQLKLGVKNICSLSRNFAKEEFTVIIDDVVSTTERLDLYFEQLKGIDLRVFLLLPDETTVEKRDLERSEGDQMGERALILHKRFQDLIASEQRWEVLDSSNQSPEQTVDELLRRLR